MPTKYIYIKHDFLMGYGMHREPKKYICSGKKNAHRIFSEITVVLFVIPLIFFTVLSMVPSVFSKTPMYIPTTPAGTTFGFVDIEYEYVIVTMNHDSYWMFDWDDGTTTTWLQLEDDQTSIVQTHHWSTPGTYQLRMKFKSEQVPEGVWSNPLIVDITTYTSNDFPNKPILRTGKIQGIIGNEYTYSALTTDPNEYQVSYRFDYGDGNLSEWTPNVPSGSSSYRSFTWEKPGEYSIRAQARNQYGLESVWSYPVWVNMKNTSEDNGTSVDLVFLNDNYYQIIYSSSYNGTFYNPSSGGSNDIQWKADGVFLIDDDSDGRWEYLYAPTIGEIQPYQEQVIPLKNIFSDIPWLLILIIVSIILGVIGVVVVLIKKGYIYMYEEEISVEK
jgi:hypothetical protein